jgi:hypothetical protein
MQVFYKSGEQVVKPGPVWRIGISGREIEIRTRCRKVNMGEIYKWKQETC